jgi:hypothetical protein
MNKRLRIVRFDEHAQAKFKSKLAVWKDRYIGQRCFCVGNGPSLKDTPLDLIKNEYSFGLNRIAEIYPSTTWRPTFYVNVTLGIADEDWADSAKKAIKNTPSFIDVGCLPFAIEAPDRVIEIPDNVYPVDVTKGGPWRYDITKGLDKTGSSMLAVLQIAVYMGFNPIYLIGCDCKWLPFDYEEDKDPNHFIDSYWAKMLLHGTNPVEVTPALAARFSSDSMGCHWVAKDACDRKGVKVYNATAGGDLEIYPRVSYEEIVDGR